MYLHCGVGCSAGCGPIFNLGKLGRCQGRQGRNQENVLKTSKKKTFVMQILVLCKFIKALTNTLQLLALQGVYYIREVLFLSSLGSTSLAQQELQSNQIKSNQIKSNQIKSNQKLYLQLAFL